ncbi:MAG: M42 family metallopeptidase [Candidatus Diapherotrites archaeon]|nr:M42 family metallopeptidase [Candidatus Diapherotrites archaeon]MDZ4256398.1 M42 family metallopeptidase [archaeon]
MGKPDFKILHELIDLNGTSGNEQYVREYIMKTIKPHVQEMRIDKLGNLICHKKGKKPTLMIAAHMDEIGLIVKRIEENGRIFVSALGGVNTLNVVGQTVSLYGKKGVVKGIITTKEINNDYETTQLPEINDIFVDTGMGKKQLLAAGVQVGNYLGLERTDHEMGNPDFISGKALDDRVGCFALIEVAKRMKHSTHDLYLVFTIQEEVGLYGAKVSAYAIDPELAVAVDVSNANDANDEPTKVTGKGPVLTIKDDELIGNRCLNDYFEEVAKKKKIPLQLEVSNFGTTDAITISLSKGGVPATALGVAVRNIHTTHSVASMKDITQLIDMLEEFCQHPPLKCIE